VREATVLLLASLPANHGAVEQKKNRYPPAMGHLSLWGTSLRHCAVGIPFPLSIPNFIHLFTEQVRELAEERAASMGAIASLENANRLLEGTSKLHCRIPCT